METISVILPIVIPFLVQFYKTKRQNPAEEEIRFVFFIFCLIGSIIYFFISQNENLLNSVIKIVSYASATYYIIKGIKDLNEKNKIL